MADILSGLITRSRRIKPGQVLVIGFFLVILTGAILLTLPFATTASGRLDFLDALFTATSAVCVTGLVVANTGTAFTLFGQIVIILLIQVGGLGFMTMASLIFIMVGKRISLRERLVIQEAYNLDSIQGVVRLVRNAVIVTFTAEAAGAVVLSFRMIPEFGVAKGIYHSAFLSVSAFCNAGFSPLPNSLIGVSTYLKLVVCVLIVCGGLGFCAIYDIVNRQRGMQL